METHRPDEASKIGWIRDSTVDGKLSFIGNYQQQVPISNFIFLPIRRILAKL